MKYIIIILSVISLIFISGCTTTTVGGGLSLSLYADPPTIFSSGITTLYIDIDNKDVKTVNNVDVTAFDTGLLQYLVTEDWQYMYEAQPSCHKTYDDFAPGQFDTFLCKLRAPYIEQQALQTDVHVRATFDTELSVVQLIEMMSVDEYERRTASGKFTPKPQTYSYQDKYVELQIEFSEQLPVVVRQGKKYFAYFTITNIGNGFIGPVEPGDFYIEQPGNILKCKQEQFFEEGGITNLLDKTIEPVGRKFPRIACEILMPGDIEYLANYDITVRIRYNYEIRDKISVNIRR